MNFFACLLITFASFSLATNLEGGGMVMLSGPLIHRRIIHRRPFLLRHHRKRHTRRHRLPRKAFIEVVNVRERVVVDEQNHPKGAEAVLSNDLLAVNPSTGQVKMLMHRELHIKPKLPTNSNLNSNTQRKFIINEYGIDGALRQQHAAPWLQSFIKRFHLDSFWPLFAFSVLAGFTFVGLIFVAAKCILTLIEDEESGSKEYAPLLSDEALLATVESAQPIQLTEEMTERGAI